MGPTLAVSNWIHETKYRGIGESFDEAMYRIASATKDDDSHYKELTDVLRDQRFLPAGRVQAAMGSPKAVTPYNCFVSGIVEDSFDDIMEKATEAGRTMRLGGGIGYDFSRIRPRGELITTLGSPASGPVSFMQIFDAVCKTISSAGHRRGAQMSVLRIDHPDIEEFIHAKQNITSLTAFNISIGVTDEFMEAVLTGNTFQLKWGGRVYKTVDAATLWEQIMRSTWDWAEPGVLFIDRINEMNNLYYCETIEATNPCAEQPLPPYGACLLGSFNLVKYITPSKAFDYDQFEEDIGIAYKAMDNIIDVATYPLPQQREEAKNKRRMGLGVTGAANAIEAMGHRYGEESYLQIQDCILETLNDTLYLESAKRAKVKGAFPLFHKEKYMQGKFIKRLPADVRKMIAANGIRNSHLTSIAPTGTISLAADNVSSGIEPVFSHGYTRTIQTFDGPITENVTDYGARVFGVKGKTADECTADDHVNTLIHAYKYVDSAVSKTCNVSPDMPWDSFKDIYVKAWQGGTKGCTTFNSGGKRGGVLVETPKEESLACYINEDGTRSCDE